MLRKDPQFHRVSERAMLQSGSIIVSMPERCLESQSPKHQNPHGPMALETSPRSPIESSRLESFQFFQALVVFT